MRGSGAPGAVGSKMQGAEPRRPGPRSEGGGGVRGPRSGSGPVHRSGPENQAVKNQRMEEGGGPWTATFIQLFSSNCVEKRGRWWAGPRGPELVKKLKRLASFTGTAVICYSLCN